MKEGDSPNTIAKWLGPVLLSLSAAFGLTLALLGDGWADSLSALALLPTCAMTLWLIIKLA